jgi:hypothetical protein
MGNDNEIKKDTTETSSSEFLPEEIRDTETRVTEYSIEKEFARTKKNRSLGLIFFMVGFIAAALAATIIGSALMQQKNRQVEVKIDDFQDLRLKDLLDKAQQNEARLDELRTELTDLKLEKEKEILKIKEEYRIKRERVVAANLSDNATDRRIRTLKNAENREIAKVRSDYNEKIDEKEKEIEELEKKLDSEVYEKGEAASNVDKLYKMKIDNLKQKHAREMREQKNYYERYIDNLILKYNPVYRSYELRKIIRESDDVPEKPELKAYNPVIEQEIGFPKSRFEKLHQRVEDRDLIVRRMDRIPYENSIPPSIKRIDNLSDGIVHDYETLWSGLASRLSHYSYAFEFIMKTRPESGYIIDPRNPQNIQIYVNRYVNVPSGTTAFVFRDDDEFIGKIRLDRSGSVFRASVVEVAPGKTMRPLDKILLKMKGTEQ